MTRFHDLDALRALAMLLVLVLHCLLFVVPDPHDRWPVQEAWAAEVPGIYNPYVHLFLLIHAFTMPAFFLLSGFFAAVLWRRRGLRPLVENRLKRIGLPLAVSVVTVVPACLLAFTAFGDRPFSDPDPLNWPVFFHLWFLWYLLWLLALFVSIAYLGVKFTSPAWWLLIPLAVLPLFLMTERTLGPDTSATLLPDPNILAYYAAFFFFGVFFHQRRMTVRRWWAVGVIPAMTAVYIGALAFLTSEPQSPGWAIFSLLKAVYAWSMCLGMMGLFRWIAHRERVWMRYISDASYFLYVAHLPLVAAVQGLLLETTINVHLKLVLVLALVFGTLLATYHLGVRYTVIGEMLNGRRHRRSRAP